MNNKTLKVLFFSFLYVSTLLAKDVTPDNVPKKVVKEKHDSAPTTYSRKTMIFNGSVGAMAGLFMHELAHYVVLESGGYYYDHSWGWQRLDEFDYTGESNSVQLAGFVEQLISTELILRKKKRTPFLYGWLAYNTINGLWYPLKSYVTDGGHKDLASSTIGSRTRNIASSVLVSHTLFTLYRLKSDKDLRYNINMFFDFRKKSTGVAFSYKF